MRVFCSEVEFFPSLFPVSSELFSKQYCILVMTLGWQGGTVSRNSLPQCELQAR